MAQKLNENNAVTYYEAFINDTLKEDLKVIDAQLQKLNAQIAEFVQIKKTLEVLQDNQNFQDGFKTQMDIGCNFFMEAKVEDTSSFLFDIGLNTYLELNHKEAMKYIEVRMEALERATELLRTKSAETKAHIKLMLFHIGELQNINTSN